MDPMEPTKSFERRAELRSFVELAYQTGRVVCAPNMFGTVVRILDALAPAGNTATVEISVDGRLAKGTMLTGQMLAAGVDHIADR